jgi:hypothetical protein
MPLDSYHPMQLLTACHSIVTIPCNCSLHAMLTATRKRPTLHEWCLAWLAHFIQSTVYRRDPARMIARDMGRACYISLHSHRHMHAACVHACALNPRLCVHMISTPWTFAVLQQAPAKAMIWGWGECHCSCSTCKLAHDCVDVCWPCHDLQGEPQALNLTRHIDSNVRAHVRALHTRRTHLASCRHCHVLTRPSHTRMQAPPTSL